MDRWLWNCSDSMEVLYFSTKTDKKSSPWS